jgi:hypothetical protein
VRSCLLRLLQLIARVLLGALVSLEVVRLVEALATIRRVPCSGLRNAKRLLTAAVADVTDMGKVTLCKPRRGFVASRDPPLDPQTTLPLRLHLTRRVAGPHRMRPRAGSIVPSVLPGCVHIGLMPVIKCRPIRRELCMWSPRQEFGPRGATETPACRLDVAVLYVEYSLADGRFIKLP